MMEAYGVQSLRRHVAETRKLQPGPMYLSLPRQGTTMLATLADVLAPPFEQAGETE